MGDAVDNGHHRVVKYLKSLGAKPSKRDGSSSAGVSTNVLSKAVAKAHAKSSPSHRPSSSSSSSSSDALRGSLAQLPILRNRSDAPAKDAAD